MVILKSDEAEECFMVLTPSFTSFTQEQKELAWLRLRQLFAALESGPTQRAGDLATPSQSEYQLGTPSA
jgi:hypothetical protein